MGQLRAVAETFYKLKLEIEVMDQEVKFDTIHVSFKLTFDNKVQDRTNSALIRHGLLYTWIGRLKCTEQGQMIN